MGHAHRRRFHEVDALMRVLHVIGPLRTGGAQTQLLGLVRAAHGRHWDATVLATSGGATATDFRALGCEFHELRRIGSPGLLRIARTRSIVGRGDFDVIHGNLWQSNAYSRAAVLGKRKRPAVVISERNVEANRSVLRRSTDRVLSTVTDAYVGNTEAVCDFIREVHPTHGRPVETIANAVDSDIFRPKRQRSGGVGTVRIGAVGRLDAEKGFDVLIDATRVLTDRGLSVEVEIVGEGSLRDDLANRSAGLPVELRGPLDPGEVIAGFLRSLDVFVLPSRFREGRPNVVLEAMATGLPVVTTDIAGIQEIFAGDTLVRPDDALALASGIEEAAADPARWIERSAGAPIDDFDQLARRYLDLFERVRSRPPIRS